MSVQAALGSDIALVFDECTPFHVTREYTERSMERTHRWLERCLLWHAEHGPAGQAVYGIVQGGVDQDLRASSAVVAESSLRRDRDRRLARAGQGPDARGRVLDDGGARAAAAGRPRHLLGIGDVDDLIAGVEMGIDTFDCAMPTRLGRHGVALVPDPEARWRVDLVKGRWRESREPILDGCPCPACARRLLPRLPALPAAGRRAHRAAARHAPQPLVRGAADGETAAGDRRRRPRRRAGPARPLPSGARSAREAQSPGDSRPAVTSTYPVTRAHLGYWLILAD